MLDETILQSLSQFFEYLLGSLLAAVQWWSWWWLLFSYFLIFFLFFNCDHIVSCCCYSNIIWFQAGKMPHNCSNSFHHFLVLKERKLLNVGNTMELPNIFFSQIFFKRLSICFLYKIMWNCVSDCCTFESLNYFHY